MTFICIVIAVIALFLILAVLMQNPKSGMAANFGAANQVAGVRETNNFLEKVTWVTAIAIAVLSLVTVWVMDDDRLAASNNAISKDSEAIMEKMGTQATMPNQIDLPTAEEATPAEETAAPATEE